ncbi:hypothetical protein [Pectobacterium brasiliense]|uniref:hypothetical protein n=1 Tax=Pectobacterium brasiliense TaxID=180957 RepID=UPI002A80EBAD|nr:hypothetical protein [Pectobacterium brasiliense]MDY4347987.1 hypothetical protein [Pectobacterium brasiliense]
MAENKEKEFGTLKEMIRQTETTVSAVAEFISTPVSPPSSDSMPIPVAVESDEKETPLVNLNEDCVNKKSETDELQGAWLASLDKKTNDLNTCLDEINVALSDLSKNVENLEAEARMKNAKADGVLADNAMKKQMADRTFCFMVVWCLFIGSLIMSYLIAWEGKPPMEFMLGLLGTCTISIIGLVGFVVSGLFKPVVSKGE